MIIGSGDHDQRWEAGYVVAAADSLQPKVGSALCREAGDRECRARDCRCGRYAKLLRLRLGHGLPQRAVAQSLRLSQGAVSGYLSRARLAGLGWPLPDDVDDERLEALLYPPPPDVP